MSIVLENIRKEYTGGKDIYSVLDSLNLAVNGGESISIIGPSGSGKSTLLQIMGLLDYPTYGRVLISGIDYASASEAQRVVIRRRFIGFIYQFHYLLLEFTVLENLVIPQLINNMSQLVATKRAEFLLERLNIIEKKNCIASQLSGGEQQRVAVARALANSPKIILADEPTGNLDASNANIVADLLFEEAKEQDISVVLVTHNTEIAKRANRSFTLKNGGLV